MSTDLTTRPRRVTVFDLETYVQLLGDKRDKTDNSPFNKSNKCVGVWWLVIEDGEIGKVRRSVWNHDEQDKPDSREAFQQALDSADLIVAHNAKFDVIWLLEMGFKIPEKIWCTMIGEYIFSRSQRILLSLKETAERRDVTRKKSDLVDKMFKEGIGFEKMPLDIVDEYAAADVQSCAEIYLQQISDLQQPENSGLKPVFTLMNQNLEFLSEIERNGVAIDRAALEVVEKDFTEERDQLIERLKEIAAEVLGDRPFNLNSGPDQTAIVYGREVVDRKLHARMFNIGVGSNGKKLPIPRMKTSEFNAAVRGTTVVLKRTIAECCPSCNGSGRQYRVTKKGEPYKNQPRCKTCEGSGAIYLDTGTTAGLRLVPKDPTYASINGFKVDKDIIKKLISQARLKNNLLAVEYLEKMSRLNAVNTYINSFINGIKTWTREDGILHPNFNQTVARTARLSSTNPNFQNQPKSNKFPVRKCVVSRFENGQVCEIDFSGLEFRVAGQLSQDRQIMDDISSGKDVHKQTATIINQIPEERVTKQLRSEAKAYTFAPLYGGMGLAEEAHIRAYFQEYFNIYKGLKVWHRSLMDGVLQDGLVRTPSGREFFFPNVKRQKNGRVTNATSIVNYPVQSFATGDIVPLSCIRALRYFREHNLKSKLILTVHDSIVVDVFPDEMGKVKEGLTWAMEGVHSEIKERFDYTFTIPLDTEIEAGKNWMEMVEID